MKKLLFMTLLLFAGVWLNAQIVTFETTILINGEETTVLTQSADRADLIAYLTNVIESASITPTELGIDVNSGDCPYEEVIGGNFDAAVSSSPYPNGVSPVFLSRKNVIFYNNTAFPAADVWAGLPNNLNAANYIYKIVAIPK